MCASAARTMRPLSFFNGKLFSKSKACWHKELFQIRNVVDKLLLVQVRRQAGHYLDINVGPAVGQRVAAKHIERGLPIKLAPWHERRAEFAAVGGALAFSVNVEEGLGQIRNPRQHIRPDCDAMIDRIYASALEI